jgi:hypothetical protein
MQMMMAAFTAQAIYVAAELGIADSLAHGPRTADDLAAGAGVDAGALYRVLRCLGANGVFTEVEPRVFALNEVGAYLRDDAPGGLRHTAQVFGAETFRAFAEIMHSVRTGQPAFDMVFGMPFYDYLAKHEDLDRRFDRVVAETNHPVRELLLRADVGDSARIIDVGGRHGALLADMLVAHPSAHGVLFELPETAQEAETYLAGTAVADRCEIRSGDFFVAVPPGGDVYLLTRCLHNWNDDDAVRILQTIRAAMSKSARLLVVERLLPPGTGPGIGKIFDLVMLVALGGRERTEQEYVSLMSAAGLQAAGTTYGAASTAVIEVVSA